MSEAIGAEQVLRSGRRERRKRIVTLVASPPSRTLAELDALVEAASAAQAGLSPASVKTYRAWYLRFAAWAKANHPVDHALTRANAASLMTRWFATLPRQPGEPGAKSYPVATSAGRKLLAWLQEELPA